MQSAVYIIGIIFLTSGLIALGIASIHEFTEYLERRKKTKKYKIGKIMALDEKYLKSEYGITVSKPIFVTVNNYLPYTDTLYINADPNDIPNLPLLAARKLYCLDLVINANRMVRELTELEAVIYGD